MPRRDQVGPAPDEGDEEPPPSYESGTTKVDMPSRAPLAPAQPMLELLKFYVKSKFCYHPQPLANARILNPQQSRIAYQLDLWTLMEQRNFRKAEKPYNDEPIPGEMLKGLFDYEYEQPSTILKKSLKENYILSETQYRTHCGSCNGAGIVDCSHCSGRGSTSCYACTNGVSGDSRCTSCAGRGFKSCTNCGATGKVNCKRCATRGHLLHYWVLMIKWYTIHSISYQTNTPLPNRKIKKAPGKAVHLKDEELDWGDLNLTPRFTEHYQELFANQNVDYPVKLELFAEQFRKNHLKKTRKKRRISQLEWVIQSLPVTEVLYEAEGYLNKRDQMMGHNFRFFYYGQDNKGHPLIYENDYPMNTCGCFGPGCAHYSKCCTVQ